MRTLNLTTFWWLLILTAGCQDGPRPAALPHEDLDATLWVQTSAEYLTLATLAYRQAAAQLAAALEDPAWSAIPEQAAHLRSVADGAGPTLPPAVILDVDETVLNNSGYQVRQIEDHAEFDATSWARWVRECQSEPVPGVTDFIQECRRRGVAVFYSTNRDASQERYTRRSLQQLGLIDAQAVDNILSKNERDEWTSDKTSRRNFVASRYRVLLLIGDDLNDFVWAGDHASPLERRETAASHASQWGNKWFLIPNPNYGGWEKSLSDYDDRLSRADILAEKHKALTGGLPAAAAGG